MESDDKKLVKNELKKYASLEAVTNSDGGKLIVKGLKQDIVSAIDQLSTYRSCPEIELRTLCAVITERLNLLRTLLHAPKNKKFALKDLELILEQEPDEEL